MTSEGTIQEEFAQILYLYATGGRGRLEDQDWGTRETATRVAGSVLASLSLRNLHLVRSEEE